MFIHATAARHFGGGKGITFDTKPDFLGEAPDWLKDNDYFKACVSDKTITYVGAPPVAVTKPAAKSAKK
ncbi:MAG TPA: hypothetical protein DG942_02035 [Ruminococcaceae bacterium]|jgi:hypothetical protein|nr:hypothetical protein [Oscillospiraceae bacterium]